MADGSTYALSLLVNLWPLVLGAAILVAFAARWRRRRVWTALGLFTFALVVLSFPSRATWSDTCNDLSGAALLITRPVTQQLMNHGIGVLPDGMQTLVLCPGVGDREWNPFWRGDDHLPPGPGIYGSMAPALNVPKRLYRTPAPLPGRRLERIAIAYWPERDNLYAVVETDQEPATAPPRDWPPVDLRIGGVRFDDDQGLGERGARSWYYSVVWVTNPRLPAHARGDELRVDLEYRGRRLASGGRAWRS